MLHETSRVYRCRQPEQAHSQRVSRRDQKYLLVTATPLLPKSTNMRIVLLALVVAALAVTETTGTKHLKFLPAVRASLSLGSSLLRHVAEIKDRLRADVERHLLRHAEHHGHEVHVFRLPNWNPYALEQKPWTRPSFHGSFSYQASAAGGLPILPLPFFPRPRPAVMLVPCRSLRTHISHFVLPCIKIVHESRPASAVFSQPGNDAATTNGVVPRLRTTTAAYETNQTEEQVTGVVTRAADVSTTLAYQTSETEATTSVPTSDVTATDATTSDVAATDAATFALVTRAADVTTVTANPDVSVATEGDSTDEPSTEDGKSNMIPHGDESSTSSASSTTEETTKSSTSDMDFNDILKEAEAAFAKLTDQQRAFVR
ncbi:hypothetical protein HPB50_012952 [Hyalomma asiaticum]|uniref:Uncharacterized protein n=1 Tax=Hyalomma asiaticum TaxID=266040 RepID=A0ACB7RX78_HYAAI|nr:hypothetical protein HPB50_012952 [Hyalomma asiaticum]